jgi:hypothetical protein
LPVLAALAVGFILFGGLTIALGVWNQEELSVARSIAAAVAAGLRRRRDDGLLTMRR